ncbi:pleckstrin homology domain-containing family F member 1-like [Anguilla anguilla]|uniref:pleckstrin homology domain-containing family F member 1-like n=1 Tax=Anguilla anguilla TaxID=7936 RepID=UPI0015A8F0D1|nr:pleckstrin homology domain-containing family F member 1-like [Anguilla anguilla]
MGHQLAFTEQNAERILAVQGLFGTSGKPLAKPGRVLVGEGHLLKLCRRSPQPRAFFLFNDILVYGSVVILGRWYANQQVVALEDVSLEDAEDGLDMKHQWLVRTPRKSFYVSAASAEEKRAWMEHIGECRAERLRRTGKPAGTRFAAVWVPDRASAVCMRCCSRFGLAQRRHHCRRCGFVVCASCSRARRVIPEISPKPVRVCRLCHQGSPPPDPPEQGATLAGRGRGGSDGKNSSEEDESPYEPSSGEDDCEEGYAELAPAQWESQNHVRNSSWSPYVDLSNHLQISDMGNY